MIEKREIKFRAFDHGTNKMIVTGFHVIGEVTMFGLVEQYLYENKIDGKPTLERFNDVEITEFVNEVDNHGNELYEGDIVQTWCYNKLQNHIIEWTREGFKAGGYHLDSIYFKGGGDAFKVIGNIFQSPELTIR